MEFILSTGAMAFILFVFLTSCIIIVKPKTGVLVHQFGGAVIREISSPGIYFKLPAPIHTTGRKIPLSLDSVTEKVKVKTSDEVFMTLEVNILCVPRKNALEKAMYNLDNPAETIKQLTSEKVKSICVEMNVKDIYSKKDDISEPTKQELSDFMLKNGWNVVRVVVQDPVQSKEVEEASNRVYAAKRALEASEVEKKVIFNESVGAAEADAESLTHRTRASIESRRLVAESYVEIVQELKNKGIEEKDIPTAINMIEMIERKDMLTTVAKHGSLVVADVASPNSSDFVNAGLIHRSNT